MDDWPKNDKMKQGRKEMFYLMMHATHFIYHYMASNMVKDHSHSESYNKINILVGGWAMHR